MRFFGLLAIVLGVFLLRSAYLTYQDDPDALTAPDTQESNPNAPEAIKAHYQQQHQIRQMMEIEGLGGGVLVMGGLVLLTIRRG